MDTGSNVSSGEFVSMVCTWAECTVGGQMHKECYEKQEKVARALPTRPAPHAQRASAMVAFGPDLHSPPSAFAAWRRSFSRS